MSSEARKQCAIEALLTCGSLVEAAGVVKVSTRTLRRWLRDPSFRGMLRDAETDAIGSASRRAAALGSKALSVLEGVMLDCEASPMARVSAAGRILDTVLKLRELFDAEERLVSLERRLDEQEKCGAHRSSGGQDSPRETADCSDFDTSA